MATVLGRILESSADIVKGVTFDAHQSHTLFRQLLFGQLDQISPADQEHIRQSPFWKDCTYRALPPHSLPRLPAQICLHEGSAVWPLPGPCALSVLLNDILLFVFIFIVSCSFYSYVT